MMRKRKEYKSHQSQAKYSIDFSIIYVNNMY
jgi:hypothetical protein